MNRRRSPVLVLSAAVLSVLQSAQAAGAPHPRELLRGMRRDVGEDEGDDLLLLVPPTGDDPGFFAHRSHRSHSSHYSGSGRRGGSYYPSYRYDPAPAAAPAPPPVPARVSFVAYPGGSIFVDGRFVGRDETSVMRLSAGEHVVRVENAFLRSHEARITLSPDQRGTIVIEW